MSQSYLKASEDGQNGSGKSGTAARLSVGIAKERCDSAAVIAYSSDDRWRIYKRTIFDVEKVPLVIVSGESLNQVQEAAELADKGCSVFVMDDLTVPWKEGVSAFSEDDGYLSFERREQLMNQWRPVLRAFRLGKFHAIGVGRLGYVWENLEDEESGRRRLTQLDSKFNAGGGENFGYEADLELEMRRQKRRIRELLRIKTMPEYICDVIKDAGPGILNGQQFVFQGQQGLYQPGDYKKVYRCFAPYLDFMQQIGPPDPAAPNTRDLLVTGKTPWKQDQDERGKLLEEFSVLLDFCFPGGEGKSKQATMFRNLTVEFLTGSVSWSRMADECPTERLRFNRDVARAMRYRIEKEKEIPTNQDMLNEFLLLCKADVEHPGSTMTFTEALLGKTLHKGPQPITKVLDRPREAAGD